MIGEKDLIFNSKLIEVADTCSLNNHSGSISSLSAQSWVPTLEKSINAIVSIKANCVRSFDTGRSG